MDVTKPTSPLPNGIRLLTVRRGEAASPIEPQETSSTLWKTESAVALLSARTRTVFSLQSEVIVSIDREGMILWSSRTIALPFGIAEKGLRIAEITLEEDAATMQEVLADIFERRLAVSLEVAVINDGRPVLWFDARLAPVIVDDAVVEAVAVVRDITETRVLAALKQNRNEVMAGIASLSVRLLRAESDELDALIMQALEMLSLHSNMDYGLLYWIDEGGDLARATHEWRAATLPPREWLVKGVKVHDHPRALRDLSSGLPYQVTRGPAHPATERERETLDRLGTNAYLLVPISGTDRLVGFLAFESRTSVDGWGPDTVLPLRIAADALGGAIIRNRMTDELLAANLELVRAGRLKDEFLATMSHELRTPLTSILGLVDVLRMQHEHPLTDRQLHFVDVIEQSGRQLLTLINDVLDIAKIESGMMQLAIEHCRLDDVCTTAIDLVKVQADARDLTLHIDLQTPPIYLHADPMRCQQMLLNLLSNAIKFTPPGGRITVQTRLDQSAQQVHISVHDTGIGIPAEDIPRLFLPFIQLRSDRKREHGGTGLGLALVQRMAELHGGSITVESAPGAGSIFTIILPLQPPAP